MLSVAVAQQLHPTLSLLLLSTNGTLPGRHCDCTFQLFSKSAEQLLRWPIQMSHPNIKWVEKRPQCVVVAVSLTDNIWHLANANDPNVPNGIICNQPGAVDSFPPVQQYDNNNGCYAGSTTSCEQLLDCRCASVRLFCTDRCAPVGFLTNWRWNDDFLHNPDHFHR